MKQLMVFILAGVASTAGCSGSVGSGAPASGGSGGSNGFPTGGSGGVTGGTGGSAGVGGGSGGSAGSGGAAADGSSGAGGAARDGGRPDAPSGGGADGGAVIVDGSVAGDGGPVLQECPRPSVSRITMFQATGEGTTTPMTGTLLVREGDHYVAREEFLPNAGSDPWHVLEILIGNVFDFTVNLTASAGFTMTYSSTGDLFMQMRPAAHWDGGAQWVTRIPSTGGTVRRQTFPFAADQWIVGPTGRPTWTYASALADVRGLLLVGNTTNTIVISELSIDGYTPVCR